MSEISLAKIIRQKIPNNNSTFHDGCLYYVSKKITVEELSVTLGKVTNEIIDYFWKQGRFVNKNQCLPWEWLENYCQSKKIRLEQRKQINFGEIIKEYLTEIDKNASLNERPPVVSIMGHINHGKTTLLDTICQTQVQEKEEGGITQKVTASQIEFQNQKITFLDTPGHSDFIKMRKRGISLTDLVVLVIDAKDGVMEQTEDIINYLHDYELPVIVFINHKKPAETNNENNLNRIKGQCQQLSLSPLEWISEGNAREKTSIQNLLEIILLFSADFKTKYSGSTHGVIIDNFLHPRSKVMLTELLVQGGCLREKDKIFLNGEFGQAKIIFDSQCQKIQQAVPGDLVRVVGFNSLTELGDMFLVIKEENTRKEIKKSLSDYWEKKNKVVSFSHPEQKKNLNLILLADSQNSLETLSELVENRSNRSTNFTVIWTAVGKLNNYAENLAKITQATTLAFGCHFSSTQKKFFWENNLTLFSSKIIYEISDKLEEIIENKKEKKRVEKILGVAEIKKIFPSSKMGNIAGCQVISGKITRNNSIYLLRKGKQIFTGVIRSLESNKTNTKEINSGHECGIVLKGFDDFQVGDKITNFQILEE